MSELHEIDAGPARTAGSVIFVHGLGGDPFSTWGGTEKRGGPLFWPGWIAEELPSVSVYSLEYDAHPTRYTGGSLDLPDRGRNVLNGTISQGLAHGPIAFVSHSLGGLVVKQVLREANDRKDRDEAARAFLDCVAQVVFIATPHSGSEVPHILEYVPFHKRLLRPNKIVQFLEYGNTALEDLKTWYTDFCDSRARIAGPISHLAFRETVEMFGRLIVDPVSSNPGVPGGAPDPIDRKNHVEICRPSARSDELYLKVLKFLKGLPSSRSVRSDGRVKVFLNHAAEDGEHAEAIAFDLEQRGISIEIDQEPRPQAGRLRKIEQITALSARIVTLWSPTAVVDEQVIAIASRAAKAGKHVGYRLGECRLPKALGKQPAPLLKDVEAGAQKIAADLGVRPITAPAISAAVQSSPDVQVKIDSLPQSSGDFFGRTVELNRLHGAWNSEQVRIVTIQGLGGSGKTALLRRFLSDLRNRNWGGAKRVYGWSAEGQGSSHANSAFSADHFFIGSDDRRGALEWFGSRAKVLDHEKGPTLAKLVQSERSLVILDGIERLQVSQAEKPSFRDESMKAFIEAMKNGNCGMVILTSQEKIGELEDDPGQDIVRLKLDRLDEHSGIALLRSRRVHGDHEVMKQVVEYVRGHPLTLSLLGNWLGRDNGDIREWEKALSEVWSGTEDFEDGERCARHLMASYVERLKQPVKSKSSHNGQAELNLLSAIGLFDRPLEATALKALVEGEPIRGVTDVLGKLGPQGLGVVRRRLENLALLLPRDPNKPYTIDAHPMVRRYFADELKRTAPDCARAAHKRLYDHYCGIAKPQPDTREGMAPLVHAIKHGCAAGLHKEAFDEILFERMLRQRGYIVIQLGEVSMFLEALAPFFVSQWSQPLPGLSLDGQKNPLSYAAFALRSIGRLQDAVQPWEFKLQHDVARSDWRGASLIARELAELHYRLGEPERGRQLCEQAIHYAEQGGDKKDLSEALAIAGAGLHFVGELAEAQELFTKAERTQAEIEGEPPHLYSVSGYRHCELLLAMGRHDDALKLSTQMLELTETRETKRLVEVALSRLAEGRAAHAVWRTSGNHMGSLEEKAAKQIDCAIEELRDAKALHFLPAALLARITLNTDRHKFPESNQDLHEVLQLEKAQQVTRDRSPLFVDFILESARQEAAGSGAAITPLIGQHLRLLCDRAADQMKAMNYNAKRSLLNELRARLQDRQS